MAMFSSKWKGLSCKILTRLSEVVVENYRAFTRQRNRIHETKIIIITTTMVIIVINDNNL
jgi:hypothetical protein